MLNTPSVSNLNTIWQKLQPVQHQYLYYTTTYFLKSRHKMIFKVRPFETKWFSTKSEKNCNLYSINTSCLYLRCVGKISVIRQSSAALPQLITPLKTAEIIRFCLLLYTKYIPIAHNPDVTVLKTVTENR